MTDTAMRVPGEGVTIDEITSLYYFEFDDAFRDEPEAHDSWELVFVDRGECGIVADGRSLRLSQGEMYFHKPRETHMLEVIKGVAPNIFIVTFTTRSPAMHYFEDRRLSAPMSTKQHISAILHEASATFELPFNDPKLRRLRLREGTHLFGGEQTVRLRLELMLIELIREAGDYREAVPELLFPPRPTEDEFVLRIIAFMEEHLYTRFTLEELSRALSFGKTYISRYFSRVVGYSVIEYFNMMKIHEAKRLIRESGCNFCEISERLMFSNSHYFSTAFRKYTGMTPTQYKRSCKIR